MYLASPPSCRHPHAPVQQADRPDIAMHRNHTACQRRTFIIHLGSSWTDRQPGVTERRNHPQTRLQNSPAILMLASRCCSLAVHLGVRALVAMPALQVYIRRASRILESGSIRVAGSADACHAACVRLSAAAWPHAMHLGLLLRRCRGVTLGARLRPQLVAVLHLAVQVQPCCRINVPSRTELHKQLRTPGRVVSVGTNEHPVCSTHADIARATLINVTSDAKHD